MATLEKKVEAAEQEYKDGCVTIDNEAEMAKLDLADSLVNRLVGKFI